MKFAARASKSLMMHLRLPLETSAERRLVRAHLGVVGTHLGEEMSGCFVRTDVHCTVILYSMTKRTLDLLSLGNVPHTLHLYYKSSILGERGRVLGKSGGA